MNLWNDDYVPKCIYNKAKSCSNLPTFKRFQLNKLRSLCLEHQSTTAFASDRSGGRRSLVFYTSSFIPNTQFIDETVLAVVNGAYNLDLRQWVWYVGISLIIQLLKK